MPIPCVLVGVNDVQYFATTTLRVMIKGEGIDGGGDNDDAG